MVKRLNLIFSFPHSFISAQRSRFFIPAKRYLSFQRSAPVFSFQRSAICHFSAALRLLFNQDLGVKSEDWETFSKEGRNYLVG